MRNLIAAAGLALSVQSVATLSALAEATEVRGRIDSVTVYRGQALVTRVIELPKGDGLTEVVVTDLPPSIEPGSVYAESDTGIEVRSVQFRARPVDKDVREDVRKIDAEIRAIQDTLDSIGAAAQRLADQKAYLTQMQAFVAPTAQVELTKGVLNAETLTKLTDYVFKSREAISTQELTLEKQRREAQAALDLKGRERQKLAEGSSRNVNEAVVFLNRAPGAGSLKVRYLVNDASWSPSYNARTDEKRDGVTLEYFASVRQLSGEDWGGVALELSTATPTLAARGPELSALLVGLGAPDQESALGGYAKLKEELGRQQSELDRRRNLANAAAVGNTAQNAREQAEYRDFDAGLNQVAGQSQLLDLIAGRRLRADKSVAPAVEEGLSVTYRLEGKTSLPSRADEQLLQIATMPMHAEFAKIATPVLTQYVYEEASVRNDGGRVLLAGPVAAYAGGAFVGSGQVPTVAAGESFTIGFGIDSSLRADRELVGRTESVQGGNKVVEVTYRLSVSNFDGSPAKVRLLDRLPRSNDSQLQISLIPVSDTPVEQLTRGGASDRKTGILRWDLPVPAQAFGERAAKIDYKFRMEFDKQMSVVGLGGTPVTMK